MQQASTVMNRDDDDVTLVASEDNSIRALKDFAVRPRVVFWDEAAGVGKVGQLLDAVQNPLAESSGCRGFVRAI